MSEIKVKIEHLDREIMDRNFERQGLCIRQLNLEMIKIKRSDEETARLVLSEMTGAERRAFKQDCEAYTESHKAWCNEQVKLFTEERRVAGGTAMRMVMNPYVQHHAGPYGSVLREVETRMRENANLSYRDALCAVGHVSGGPRETPVDEFAEEVESVDGEWLDKEARRLSEKEGISYVNAAQRILKDGTEVRKHGKHSPKG